MEGGTYWVCKDGEEAVGGILDISAARFAGVPGQWLAYLAVDDVDARVAEATAAGAKLMRPIFDVPGVGRIAILKDPTGAGLGWITPAPQSARSRRDCAAVSVRIAGVRPAVVVGLGDLLIDHRRNS